MIWVARFLSVIGLGLGSLCALEIYSSFADLSNSNRYDSDTSLNPLVYIVAFGSCTVAGMIRNSINESSVDES